MVDPWDIEPCSTYRGREYWVVWQRWPGVYGGRRYVLADGGSDRKRFYDEEKAKAAAEKMNAGQSAASQGVDRKGAGDE